MAERSALFEGVQIGVETVPGTGVAADKKLLATSFELGPEVEVDTFRPNGFKFPTIASLNREHTSGDISGQLSYTDIVYLMSSLVNADTPATVGTTGKEWVFISLSDGPDLPATFTIEQGSSVRAHKVVNAQVTGLTLTFNRDGTEVGGTIIGEALTDGITLTATPTSIPLEPVMVTQVGLKVAADPADLDADTYETRVFTAEWSLTDRFAPLWTLNQSTTYDVTIESEPTGELTWRVEADAAGMAMLPIMRAGTTAFVRIEAAGPTIAEGPANYALQIDTAVKITDVSPIGPEDDVIGLEWTGTFVHDADWAKAFSFTVINALATL